MLAWSAQIAPVMRGDTSLSAYRDEPTGFWLVRTLDLGFVVPLALATAVGLLRRRPLATKVVYAVVGFQTLLAAAVGGMGIAQLVRDDPNATVAFPAVVLVVALTLGALTLRLYQLYAADGGADRVDAETRRAHRDTAPRLRVIRHN
jgi:fatty acid desaturase